MTPSANSQAQAVHQRPNPVCSEPCAAGRTHGGSQAPTPTATVQWNAECSRIQSPPLIVSISDKSREPPSTRKKKQISHHLGYHVQHFLQQTKPYAEEDTKHGRRSTRKATSLGCSRPNQSPADGCDHSSSGWKSESHPHHQHSLCLQRMGSSQLPLTEALRNPSPP